MSRGVFNPPPETILRNVNTEILSIFWHPMKSSPGIYLANRSLRWHYSDLQKNLRKYHISLSHPPTIEEANHHNSATCKSSHVGKWPSGQTTMLVIIIPQTIVVNIKLLNYTFFHKMLSCCIHNCIASGNWCSFPCSSYHSCHAIYHKKCRISGGSCTALAYTAWYSGYQDGVWRIYLASLSR